jgi:hypothetical protein
MAGFDEQWDVAYATWDCSWAVVEGELAGFSVSGPRSCCRRCGPGARPGRGHRGGRWWGVLLFMGVNGGVVFVEGAARWIGIGWVLAAGVSAWRSLGWGHGPARGRG